MKQLSYDEFCEKIIRKPDTRKPLSGQWAITNDCNLSCVHCFLPGNRQKQELSFAQIKNILDQLSQEGCLNLTFTGGEPLVRDDFLDIYAYAKAKGFRITIFTNATLITFEIINYFREYPPAMIEVTLHSIKADTFEAITGVRGSFKKCMQGIKLILENNLPLTLKTVGLTLNKDDILETTGFIRKLPGVKFKFDSLVIPRHDYSKIPLKYRLAPQEVFDIETQIYQILRQPVECMDGFDIPDEVFRCTAGLTSFHINAYGALTLCSEMVEPAVDLLQTGFKEGFYNFLFDARLRYATEYDSCNKCEVSVFCSRCPAIFLLEDNKAESLEKYLCELAKIRAGHVTVKAG